MNDTRPSLLTLAGIGALLSLGVVTLAIAFLVPSGADGDGRDPSPGHSSRAQDAAPEGADALEGFAVWGLTRDGDPLRWDACRPIDLVLAPLGAPPGAEEDVREAAARLTTASGLRLRLVGLSEERPSALRPLTVRDPDGLRWNPVLIAWMTPEEAQAAAIPLEPHDRGVALPVAVRDGDREGYVTGQIVLNAARSDLRPGFADRADAWGATLLHELGHLLGLAHVEDASQLMSLDPGRGPVILGSGDLAGLELLGASAGCTPVPDAQAGRDLRPPSVRTP